MAIDSAKFENALKKISPEMASTMKLLFSVAHHKLQDDTASPLIVPKYKKRFDIVSRNLEEIQRFAIEEAGKLKESDNKEKRDIVVKKYFELLDEVRDSTEYLFMSTQDKEIEEMAKGANEAIKKGKEVMRDLGTYEPSEKEIDEVLRIIETKPSNTPRKN